MGHDVFTFVELRPIGVSSAAFHVNLRVQLRVVYITSVSAELQAVVQSSHFFLNGLAVGIFGFVNDTGFTVCTVNARLTLRHSHGAVRAVFAVDTDGTVFAVQSNASFTICTLNAEGTVFTSGTVFARTTDSHIVVQANFQRFRAVSLRDHVGVDVLVANDSSSRAQVLHEAVAVFVFQTKTAAARCYRHVLQVAHVHSVLQHIAFSVCQFHSRAVRFLQTTVHVGDLVTAHVQVALSSSAQCGGLARISFVTKGDAAHFVQVFGQFYIDSIAICNFNANVVIGQITLGTTQDINGLTRSALDEIRSGG